MSCVVGIRDYNKVIIGADSAGVGSSGELQLRRDPKVFIKNRLLFGIAGSWRSIQEVQFGTMPNYFNAIDNDAGLSTYAWLCTKFLPWLRFTVKDIDRTEMLVGFPESGLGGKPSLFHIYGGEQVSLEILGYEACGSGAQVARGALFGMSAEAKASDDAQLNSHDRVHFALDAAARFCSTVRGPFNILEV